MKELYSDHIDHLIVEYTSILEKLPFDSMMVYSGSAHLMFEDDQHYPFKVNPHFNHWLPLTNSPQCYVYFEAGKKPKLYYYLKDDFWNLPPKKPEGFWTSKWEIETYDDVQKLPIPEKCLYIGEISGMWKNKFAAVNDQGFRDLVISTRMKKTPYEVACLQKANELGVKAHQFARDSFFQGKSEYAIHMGYLETLGVQEWEQPYSNIVAFNENCGILHYVNCQRDVPAQLHSFLIDAGANFNGYASDITRTYAKEKGVFADMIDYMEKTIQLGIIDELKEGVSYVHYHERTHALIAKMLNDFNLVTGDVTDLVNEKITHKFFPHGLGHSLGIQVHDISRKPAKTTTGALRNQSLIERGHVFTIEPGLYFIPMLLKELKNGPHSKLVNWSLVDELIPFGGIRIEDNIYMGEAVTNLTREVWKE